MDANQLQTELEKLVTTYNQKRAKVAAANRDMVKVIKSNEIKSLSSSSSLGMSELHKMKEVTASKQDLMSERNRQDLSFTVQVSKVAQSISNTERGERGERYL